MMPPPSQTPYKSHTAQLVYFIDVIGDWIEVLHRGEVLS